MNIGKQRYDNIEIPEGLDAAIESGPPPGSGAAGAYARAAKTAAGMAARAVPGPSARRISRRYTPYASEIPVLGEIIRVFRVGSGGEVTDGVQVGADTRGGSVRAVLQRRGGIRPALHGEAALRPRTARAQPPRRQGTGPRGP